MSPSMYSTTTLGVSDLSGTTSSFAQLVAFSELLDVLG